MPEGFDLGLSGLASGFDWRALVDQLTEVERSPQRALRLEQQGIGGRKNAYSSIATQLGVLWNRVKTLKETSLFDARATNVSDATVAAASATPGAPLGTYSFNIAQLATAAVQQGTSTAGAGLSATNDVSGLVLSNAGFSTAVTAGTFTVNGKQVTIATSDTLQTVFDRISTATSGSVTGSYNSSTDRVTLSSASTITLGSATDTSNFLDVARLYNNGTDTVTSASALGGVKVSAVLNSANFTTAVSDGGSGAGRFKVNGVEITFDASTDTTNDVLNRINDSNAEVVASYDSVNDRFLLTNKTTGDVGIALEDVTGNFLTASGLLGGTLQRGQDALYTVNGGGQLRSHSNAITESSSGIPGLSVTALKAGASVTVGVTSDTEQIKTAINDFIAEYNRAQGLIDTNTASSTDAKGTVTAGTLAGESDAFSLAGQLRGLVAADFIFLTGAIKRLESLGLTTNGDDNNLALSDSAKLDSALANNLAEVEDLFTNSSSGLAVRLDNFLENTVGEEGSLITKQSNLDKQSAAIETQIADQERRVLASREQLIASFVLMERAQQQINQQLQFLNQRFGTQ
jgi:flagellar hook-associated protein 2